MFTTLPHTHTHTPGIHYSLSSPSPATDAPQKKHTHIHTQYAQSASTTHKPSSFHGRAEAHLCGAAGCRWGARQRDGWAARGERRNAPLELHRRWNWFPFTRMVSGGLWRGLKGAGVGVLPLEGQMGADWCKGRSQRWSLPCVFHVFTLGWIPLRLLFFSSQYRYLSIINTPLDLY